jgi:Ni2+-binding GTPase involved in maturation of urease and hydrogenase
MSKTQVILVGGFLGAGKTTLVAKATEQLVRQGKRVGLITNDQAANLVDTAILKEAVDSVQEVAGGCFCCRFDDLLGAMNRLVDAGMPDVLIGEPVGSCTDLSATVLQPMKQFHGDRFQVSPFSVLVDVKQVRTLERLRKSMQNAEPSRFPENVMYIYEKQLEEADLIVLNKADLVSADELAEVEATLKREFAQAPVITISALKGIGVDCWVDYVLGVPGSGRTITAVDYDEYADGEAALGWLNALVELRSSSGIDCRGLCMGLMKAMQKRFQEASAEIAHLKLHLTAGSDTLVANLTRNDGEPFLRDEVRGSPNEAVLLVNVRA